MSKVIVFDFDGTVADTIPISIAILKRLAKRYYKKTADKEFVKELRDKSIPEIFQALNISIIKLPFIARRARKELNKEIGGLKPINGMQDLLAKLKKQGRVLGIVSSNSRDSILTFLAKNNLGIFDFICTNRRIFGKANTLKKLLRENKWNREDIVYVGDEIRDIEAARKAGIKIISVTWGVNSLQKLEACAPDFLVRSPQELLALLESKIQK